MPENFNLAISFLTDLLWISDCFFLHFFFWSFIWFSHPYHSVFPFHLYKALQKFIREMSTWFWNYFNTDMLNRSSSLYCRYTGFPGRNVPDLKRMFLRLKYTDLTKNTYIRSWTFTEIMAREKCGLLAVPRTVPGSHDVLPVHYACQSFSLQPAQAH